MRSIRLLLTMASAVAVCQAIGCGYGGPGEYPAGIESIVLNPNAPRVMARVPLDQRGRNGGRRTLPISNNTRVLSVDEPGSGPVSRRTTNPSSTAFLVRVRVLEGADRGIEVLVPPQELSPPPDPNELSPRSMALGVLVLFGAAAIAWCIETLVLTLKGRRDANRYSIATSSLERFGNRRRARTERPPIIAPYTMDHGRWIAWIADRNTRSKNRRREVALAGPEGQQDRT